MRAPLAGELQGETGKELEKKKDEETSLKAKTNRNIVKKTDGHPTTCPRVMMKLRLKILVTE